MRARPLFLTTFPKTMTKNALKQPNPIPLNGVYINYRSAKSSSFELWVRFCLELNLSWCSCRNGSRLTDSANEPRNSL